MKQKALNAIKVAMDNGASYADIRLHMLDQTEGIYTLCGSLEDYSFNENSGYGIRTLYNGAWGFASGVDFNDLNSVARKSLENAKSASQFLTDPKEIFQDTYTSPTEIDPFSVDTKEKIDALLAMDDKLKHEKIQLWMTSATFYKRKILYFDSEGSEIEKNLLECNGGIYAYANDCDGLRQRRSFNLFQKAGGTVGWENFLSAEQFGHADRIREELLELIDAPTCKEEVCDVILLPEMMALQTHETIGHALELDRILGYELSYAGGSHVDLQHFGSLEFGSKKLTARADGTVPNSPGSFGYDDDGVKARNVVMIDQGKLVNAITSRQMVMEANRKAGREIFDGSGATCRAQSFNRLPIERMNNINVDAGQDGSKEDIIKNCQNGIMVEAPRSWSIGSNRENFHFATEIGWKIENGKVAGMVRNPTYGGDSLPFWRSLKYVGDESTWQMQQVFNCGKGQPNQVMRLGHGVPICLFSDVQVGK